MNDWADRYRRYRDDHRRLVLPVPVQAVLGLILGLLILAIGGAVAFDTTPMEALPRVFAGR